MKLLIPAVALTAATLFSPLAAQAQTTTYAGNGATGFGGEVGLGTITVSETSAGAITFGLALGNGKTSQDGNASIYYIDSVPNSGFQDTSTLRDSGTNADSVGITGGNGSTVAYFAPGFKADYAVAFQDTYLDLFKLNNDGTITYLNGNGNPAAPNAYQFTFNAADIGITATSPFSFVGTLLSKPYRSNETFGTSTTVVDPNNPNAAPNAGDKGSVTFSNFNTFTPLAAAPEPGSMVPLAMGALALGGLVIARRRTASAAE